MTFTPEQAAAQTRRIVAALRERGPLAAEVIARRTRLPLPLVLRRLRNDAGFNVRPRYVRREDGRWGLRGDQS